MLRASERGKRAREKTEKARRDRHNLSKGQ